MIVENARVRAHARTESHQSTQGAERQEVDWLVRANVFSVDEIDTSLFLEVCYLCWLSFCLPLSHHSLTDAAFVHLARSFCAFLPLSLIPLSDSRHVTLQILPLSLSVSVSLSLAICHLSPCLLPARQPSEDEGAHFTFTPTCRF